MACGQGVLSGGPVSGALSQGGMGQVKHLAEQKRAIEEELEEMRTQLETTGYSSLAQMRYVHTQYPLTCVSTIRTH